MKVPISGQVRTSNERKYINDVLDSLHYGGGKYMRAFEKGLARYQGSRFALSCNSGSSANLLALASLELPKGSRILTCAVNFPTTVAAIVQLGHVPVFVDADPKTLNAVPFDHIQGIDAAIFAHTLGNPLYIPYVDYPVIEDCADALGSEIHGRKVGNVGIMATCSFYPAHHMTTGEGGAVFVNNPKLAKVIASYRDWGRACWCAPGEDNTCGRRFAGDYDHKYSYDRLGYNMKMSDLQAAVGVAQLEEIETFHRIRRRNWQMLHDGLIDMPIDIIMASPHSNPSWFGFAFMTDRRNDLARYLEKHDIGNRPIMGGNLLRQHAFMDIEREVIGDLDGANEIHERGIYIGCFHGLNEAQIEHSIKTVRGFYA